MIQEKISVIVPAYNVEAYVGRCLESLICQTYANMEVIVINDGSTDGTLSVCQEYAKKDSRIKIVSTGNNGVAGARNTGLKNATGAYVAFVDSDDYVLPEYLEILYKLIWECSADIAICDYYQGGVAALKEVPAHANPDDVIKDMHTFTKKEILSNWHGQYMRVETVLWNKLYRRELWLDDKGQITGFSEGQVHEDVTLTHQIINKAEKIAYTTMKLYFYYMRSDSITNGDWSNQRVIDSIQAQKTRLHFFQENNYEDAERRLLLGMEKFRILYTFKLENTAESRDLRRQLCREFVTDYKSICKMQQVPVKDRFVLLVFRNTLGRILGV